MRRRCVHRRETGQATAEFAAVIPFFVLLSVLLLQIGMVMLDQLAAQQAAREGARVAAVDPSARAAVAAAKRATKLDPERLTVSVGARPDADGMVTVRAVYRSLLTVPLTDRILLRVQVAGQATMRVEQSPAHY